MRLIDLDAFMEKMRKVPSMAEQESNEVLNGAIIRQNEIYCVLEHMPIIDAVQWILPSDRLPENISPVIITWKNNKPMPYYENIKGKPFVGVAHYWKGKWYWHSPQTEDYLGEYGRDEGTEFDSAIEVVAWTTLPACYGERKEEQ